MPEILTLIGVGVVTFALYYTYKIGFHAGYKAAEALLQTNKENNGTK